MPIADRLQLFTVRCGDLFAPYQVYPCFFGKNMLMLACSRTCSKRRKAVGRLYLTGRICAGEARPVGIDASRRMYTIFNPHNAILFILSGGGFFSIIYAIGHLVQKRKSRLNYVISAIWLITGILLLLLLRDTVEPQEYERLLLTDLFEPSLNFLLGPLLYFYFRNIIRNEHAIDRSVLLHFIPAAASLIVLVPVFVLRYAAEDGRPSLFAITLERAPGLVYALSSVSVLIYLFACLKICIEILHAIGRRRGMVLYLVLLFLIVLAAIEAVLLCAIILNEILLYQLAGVIAIQLLLALYLTGRRHPEFENDLIIEYSKAKYEKSKIEGLNVEAIVKRLHDMMETERAYLNDELTLPVLSSRLGISPQQLSQIINERIGKGYSAYINDFRLKYAEQLLTHNREMTILRIAYQSGFNSKSSFNSQFKKKYGMAPTEYRDRRAGRHAP